MTQDHLALDATGLSLGRKSCARSLCPGGWCGTQQEPEDSNMDHQQERHVHGWNEPVHPKMGKRQTSDHALDSGEQQVSDPDEIEQPDQRQSQSWPEPE